jgi:hypothetical protein
VTDESDKRSHQKKTVLNVMLNEVLPLLPHLSPLNIYETSTTLTDSHDTNMDSKHGSFRLLFSLFVTFQMYMLNPKNSLIFSNR